MRRMRIRSEETDNSVAVEVDSLLRRVHVLCDEADDSVGGSSTENNSGGGSPTTTPCATPVCVEPTLRDIQMAPYERRDAAEFYPPWELIWWSRPRLPGPCVMIASPIPSWPRICGYYWALIATRACGYPSAGEGPGHARAGRPSFVMWQLSGTRPMRRRWRQRTLRVGCLIREGCAPARMAL